MSFCYPDAKTSIRAIPPFLTVCAGHKRISQQGLRGMIRRHIHCSFDGGVLRRSGGGVPRKSGVLRELRVLTSLIRTIGQLHRGTPMRSNFKRTSVQCEKDSGAGVHEIHAVRKRSQQCHCWTFCFRPAHVMYPPLLHDGCTAMCCLPVVICVCHVHAPDLKILSTSLFFPPLFWC